MSELEDPTGTGISPTDINNSGQIVGSSLYGTETHASVWEGGTITDLGTLGGRDSYATGINELGQIAGYSSVEIETTTGLHAWIWDEGVMTDIGTLGGKDSWASAINNAGQIVGTSDTAGDAAMHLFLYSGGAMNDLGTLGGTRADACDINEFGHIVGASRLSGTTDEHAFLYRDGTMLDLNDLVPAGSGWVLECAMGITDTGLIVGYGDAPNGNRHAFLLVPEPATLCLLALGGLGAMWRKR
jgi:probable HAF family extracellular repeat protein